MISLLFFGSGSSSRTCLFQLIISVIGMTFFANPLLADTQAGRLVGWGDNYSGEDNIPLGLSNVTCIALGKNDEAPFGVALMTDNTAVSWGAGITDSGTWPNYGQRIIPSGLSDIIDLSCGSHHCLALKRDGHVFSWGRISDVPSGVSNVIAVAAGGYHNLALKPDGTVVAWGENWAGQIDLPPGLSNVTYIAAGLAYSLAVRSDGTVVGWGDSAYGQISIPSGLSNVVKVAAGLWHSIALSSDGLVTGWGDNRSGQATPPTGLSNVISIASGRFHCLALKSDGNVIGWGSNNGGGKLPPPELNNVRDIVAGARDSAAISIDLKASLSRNGYSPIVRFHTFSGQNYYVQFAPTFSASNWTSLPSGNIIGNGYVAAVADTNAFLTTPTRFYRIRRLP